jgi:hypothetical protein
MTKSWGVVSLRTIQNGGLDRLTSSILPSPCTFTVSISSGLPSLALPKASDLGLDCIAVNRVPRAFCHDSPLNTAMEAEGPVAEDDRSEMKSFLGEYALCWTGKLNAIPG